MMGPVSESHRTHGHERAPMPPATAISAPALPLHPAGTGPESPLEVFPALLLNADYRPLSYMPLSVLPWQDAVRAVWRGAVVVVAEHDRAVRSPSRAMRLPAVLALKVYAPLARVPAFTRFNVFLRDRWRCQYCGQKFPTAQLTFDHVIPRARGGATRWDNIVAACRACNLEKGAQTPAEARMHPRTAPRAPSLGDLQRIGQRFPPQFLHESWVDFLYWDAELEA